MTSAAGGGRLVAPFPSATARLRVAVQVFRFSVHRNSRSTNNVASADLVALSAAGATGVSGQIESSYLLEFARSPNRNLSKGLIRAEERRLYIASMDRAASIKVLFLSQQRLLRETLTVAFSEFPDIRFLPTVANMEEAVVSIRESEPDIVLVDLNPSLFGVKVAKQLQDACPGCKILVLASHSDPVTEAQLTSAGVKGVLCKSIGIHDLAWAIREAFAGKCVYMSKDKPIAVDSSHVRLVGGMTDRESQVLELITMGLANKQIATELGISIKTVEKHRQRVMCKLQAHETAGLTWRAICMGVARSSPCLAVLQV